jgi:hypothetical protein
MFTRDVMCAKVRKEKLCVPKRGRDACAKSHNGLNFKRYCEGHPTGHVTDTCKTYSHAICCPVSNRMPALSCRIWE